MSRAGPILGSPADGTPFPAEFCRFGNQTGYVGGIFCQLIQWRGAVKEAVPWCSGLACSATETVTDLARRASDVLEGSGREREACEMRRRVMAALERGCGPEVVRGIVGEYIELLLIQ